VKIYNETSFQENIQAFEEKNEDDLVNSNSAGLDIGF
jgi:hypothetical protein